MNPRSHAGTRLDGPTLTQPQTHPHTRAQILPQAPAGILTTTPPVRGRRPLLAWALTLSLAACGGGNGSDTGAVGDAGAVAPAPAAPAPGSAPGGDPSVPAPGPTPAPGPAPAPVAAVYKLVSFSQGVAANDPDRKRFDDYVALLNQQGALGYRYINGSSRGTVLSFADDVLMVRDSDTTYTYEYRTLTADILNNRGTADVLFEQMKEQGAKGLMYVRLLGAYGLAASPSGAPIYAVLYRRDNAANTTYDVRREAYADTASAYLAVANAHGAEGFRPWATPTLFNLNDQFFIKDMKSPARYEVRDVEPVGLTFDDQRREIDAQGAQGFRWLKDARFNGQANGSNLYVRDTTQAASFSFVFLDSPDREFGATQANADQANAQAAQGLRFFDNVDAPVFFRASNCSGPLCVSPDETEVVDGNG